MSEELHVLLFDIEGRAETRTNIQFDMGSILMTGTVALLSWAGNVVLDAAKDEVQQQLAKLVKLAVQRAFSRCLSVAELHSSVGVMEVTVTSQPFSVRPRTPQTVVNTTSQLQSIPNPNGPLIPAPKVPGATAVFVFMGIIVLLQLILLFDRFFVIQLKP